MKIISPLTIILFISFAVLTSSALALDGEKLYRSKNCWVCHGSEGKSAGPYNPSLAGQKKLYLIQQITDIINGKRENAVSRLMASLYPNMSLTKDEINAISTYLSDKKLGRERPSFKNPTTPSLRDKNMKKLETLYVYAHHRDIPRAG